MWEAYLLFWMLESLPKLLRTLTKEKAHNQTYGAVNTRWLPEEEEE